MTRTIRIFRCKYTKRVIVSINGKNLVTFDNYELALKYVTKYFYSDIFKYSERTGTLVEVSIVDRTFFKFLETEETKQ